MKQNPIKNVSHHDLSVETDLSSFGCYLCSSTVARCMYKYNSTSLGMIGESLSRTHFSSCSSTTLSHPRSLHRCSRVLAYTPFIPPQPIHKILLLLQENTLTISFQPHLPTIHPKLPVPKKMCTPTEHPPAKLSSILSSYNKHKQDIHPIVINHYAKDINCFVDFTVKIQSCTGEGIETGGEGVDQVGEEI